MFVHMKALHNDYRKNVRFGNLYLKELTFMHFLENICDHPIEDEWKVDTLNYLVIVIVLKQEFFEKKKSNSHRRPFFVVPLNGLEFTLNKNY